MKKVAALVAEIKKMNASLDIPDSIKEYEGGIIDEKEFMEKLPAVVAELAIGDACTWFQSSCSGSGRDGKTSESLLLWPKISISK